MGVLPGLMGGGGDCYGCFSSLDLGAEWRSCCLHALGLDYEEGGDENKKPASAASSSGTEESSPEKEKGGEDGDRAEPTGPGNRKPPALRIVNLVPDDEDEESADSDADAMDVGASCVGTTGPGSASRRTASDPWSETAMEIRKNVNEMSDWIHRKKWDYVSVKMPEDEATLIQSTVTSFAAQTANEIESLRSLIRQEEDIEEKEDGKNEDLRQHRMGVVQVLIGSLKEKVADPFGKLQKQRSRMAVKIYNNPLQCTLAPTVSSSATRSSGGRDSANRSGATDSFDSILLSMSQEEEEPVPQVDQRFLPRRPAHRLQEKFLDSYDDAKNDLVAAGCRPQSLFSIDKKRPADASLSSSASEEEEGSSQSNKRIKQSSPSPPKLKPPAISTSSPSFPVAPKPQVPVPVRGGRDSDEYYLDSSPYAEREELEREAAQLELVRRDGDLDAVQQMEERMVDITTLLSQFSNLVSAQSEEVQQIHSAAEDAKDNVQKGKEELVDAKERTQRSRHYMASAITVMALILLFFHWILP